MKRYFKCILIVLFFGVIINVDAKVKCDDGKPGDTVNCVINNAGRGGKISNIEVSSGLTFVSCDVCNGDSYSIEPNKDANFKFKISKDIAESKTLNATFGGEDAKIKVVIENQGESLEDDSDNEATIYSVTLVPGMGGTNKTLTCTVNSLNTTCNVTLDELDNENFNGWGEKKDCTEGARGSVKVNKNITYYACYKKENVSEQDQTNDKTLLLKSLLIMNETEKINLGFSIRKFEYDIVIPTSVESLNVEAVAQNKNINVQVLGHENLKEDNNVIKIILSTPEGTRNEYIINVKKSDEVDKPLLSSLTVGGYDIKFDSEKFVYNLTIADGINSLSINPIPEKDTYEYNVEGNNNLKDGSKISILVKNIETGKTSTYVINIAKKSNNILIYLGIAGIILIILIILLVIVVKKGKKTKNNTTKPNNNVNNIKYQGQVVNNKSNIPEIQSVIPTAPTNSSIVKEVDKEEQVETLEL